MKHILVSISKSLVVQKLEDDLRAHKKKYDYHKKISDGYFDLIQQTQKKLDEVDENIL